MDIRLNELNNGGIICLAFKKQVVHPSDFHLSKQFSVFFR